MSRSDQITNLLQKWSSGNREALDERFPPVYEEARKQAKRYPRARKGESYAANYRADSRSLYKISKTKRDGMGKPDAFFAISAQIMRQIPVDYARTKHREKRGERM